MICYPFQSKLTYDDLGAAVREGCNKMTINYEQIGSKIRYFRTQKAISQEDLAEAAEVSRVFISNIERGERVASLETIIAIANALTVSVDDILGDSLTARISSAFDQQFGILSDCTKEENDILLSNMAELKAILRRYHVGK